MAVTISEATWNELLDEARAAIDRMEQQVHRQLRPVFARAEGHRLRGERAGRGDPARRRLSLAA